MKYIKRFVLLSAFISLILCLTTINDTYGKYREEVTSTSDMNIARWLILVNNHDIRSQTNVNSIITPIFEGTNDIKNGVIAPTSVGYFDVVIDSSNTDVSFNYEISTGVNENSAVKDLIVTGYSINDGEVINSDNSMVISNSIRYTDHVSQTKVRVYLKWDDSENNVMDNTADTNATLEGNALLNVNLKFIQEV